MNRTVSRKIEEHLTEHLLKTAREAGWPCIGYDYTDGFMEASDDSSTLKTCLNTDEIVLFFRSTENGKEAWASLIYGNGCVDPISDYLCVSGFEQLVMDKMGSYAENITEKMFS